MKILLRAPFFALLLPAVGLTPACDDATDAGEAADTETFDGPETVDFGDFKADAPPTPTTVMATIMGNSAGQGAVLELVVTDVWGRLPDRKSRVRIVRESDNRGLTLEGYIKPLVLRLGTPGKYRLEADIPDHQLEKLTFEVVSRGGAFSIAQPADQVTHWSFSVDPRTMAGKSETVHSLYIGLPHQVFAASGPPPRRGNEITVFDNGRDTFDAMAGDFEAMRKSLSLSLWLLKGDFELRRNADFHRNTPATQKQQSIVEYLKRMPGTRRLLLSEFNGREDGVNAFILDDSVQAFGETKRDGVELMLQANDTEVPYYSDVPVNAGGWSYRTRLLDKYPEWAGRSYKNRENFKVGKYDRTVKFTDLQAASYHQKFAVIDDETAYLGGMNMNYADWDQPELRVFEPLRAATDLDVDDREDVAAGTDDTGINPRKDYMVRVEGPLVHDINDLFHRRWVQGRKEGALYADNTSDYSVPKVFDDPDPADAGIQAQLNVTMPMPFWEHSILEGHQRAIARADDFIFIEDQYFRAPMINAMILDRMAVDPDLKLIVATKDVPYKDPGRKWTAISEKAFKDKFPDRVVFLLLRASDLRERDGDMIATFADVDIHSKMFIVDDEIMSVGSCNKNNRGLIYEGEANLLIRDDILVSEVRRHEWARMVGPVYAAQMEDPEVGFETFRQLAEYNDAVYRVWDDLDGEMPARMMSDNLRPAGLVYSLNVPMNWFFDPGADFY